MSDLDRLNRLRAHAEHLVNQGFTRDEYTLTEIDILIGDALIRRDYPETKYQLRLETLARKFNKSEKRIESILRYRKNAIMKLEVNDE